MQLPSANEDFHEYIPGLLKKYNLDPSCLNLEVTESAYMDDPSQLSEVIQKLRNAGFRIEMDDFGSGYSSLNTLKNMPVDSVKLDMNFINDNSQNHTQNHIGGKILSSVVRMVHDIGLPIVAEGVETEFEAEYLKSIGCYLMQGYYFSKPLPENEFLSFVSDKELSDNNVLKDRIGRSDAIDFLEATPQSTLLFNTLTGGAGIVEYSDNTLSGLRLNDMFFKTIGISRDTYDAYQYDMMQRITPKSKPVMKDALQKAIDTQDEASCEIHTLPFDSNGKGGWLNCRIRYLAKKAEGHLLFLAIDNITRQKAAALSETIYRNIIQNIPAGVVVYKMDSDQNISLQYVSDACCRMFDVTREEYFNAVTQGQTYGLMPSAADFSIETSVQGSTASDIPFMHVKRKDGTWFWLKTIINLQKQNDGSVYLYMTLSDISESVLLKDRLSSVAESMPGGTVQFNLNTDEITYVSSSFLQMLGYSEQEFSHAFSGHFSELVWHEDRARTSDTLNRKTKKLSCVFRVQCNNKKLKWISMSGSGVKNAEGQTDITAIMEDIDDQKLLEQQLKQNSDEMQTILNSVSGGAASFEILEDKLKLVYISQGTADLTGYSLQEIYELFAKNKADSLIIPQDSQQLLKTIRESLSQDTAIKESIRLRRKDGSSIWIGLRGKVSDNASGKILFNAVFYSLSADDDLYHSILSKTDQIFAVLDSDTYEILFANAACEKLSHESAQKASGNTCYRFLHRLDKPCEGCPLLNKDFKDNTVNEFTADGKHYRSSLSRIEWNGRNAVLAYIVDSTEAFRSQKQINDIMSNIPGGFTSFRIEKNDMIREYMSIGARKCLGYSDSEKVPDRMADLLNRVHPDDRRSIEKTMSKCIKEHISFSIDARVLLKNGTIRWINLNARPFVMDSGSLYYYGLYSNNTNQKHPEQYFPDREADSIAYLPDESVRYYRYHILNHVAEGGSDPSEFNMPYWCENMPEKMIANGSVEPESIKEWRQFFHQIDIGYKSGSANIHMHQKSGRKRWFSLSFSSLSDALSKPEGAIITYYDFTEVFTHRKEHVLHNSSMTKALSAIYPLVQGINLTKATGYMIRNDGFINHSQPLQGSFDNHVSMTLSVIPENQHERYLSFMDRDALMAFWQNSHSAKTLVYQEYDEAHKLHWVETTLLHIDNPYDEDILVISLSRTVDDQMNEEAALKASLEETAKQLKERLYFSNLIDATAPALIVVSYLDQKSEPYMVGNLPASLGYTSEELLAITRSETGSLINEKDRDWVRAKLNDVMIHQPKKYSLDYPIIKRNGMHGWLSDTAYQIHDPERGIGYVHIYLDSSEQHLLTEQLSRDRKVLNLAAAHSNRVIYFYDAASHSAVSLDSEKSYQNGLSDSYANLHADNVAIGTVYEDCRQELFDFFEQMDKNAPTGQMRLHILDNENREKWFDMQFSSILDNNENHALYGTVFSLLDISSQHEREVVYSRYQQSINASKAGSILYFESDLSADSIERYGGDMLPKQFSFTTAATHTEVLNKMVNYSIRSPQRKMVRDFFSREHLLTLYTDGRREIEQDFPVALTEHKNIRWVNTVIQLVEDPYSKHIKMFVTLSDCTEKKEAYMQVQKAAENDGMTGLYNRSTIEHMIRNVLSESSEKSCVFALLDLDNLKRINDTMGHAQGDRAIRSIAHVLKRHFRKSDLIGRAGGDEFIIFLPEISYPEAKEAINASFSSLIQEVSTCPIGEHNEEMLHCSIGCTAGSGHRDSFTTLYKRADIALYSIKRQGKDNFAFYSDIMKKK